MPPLVVPSTAKIVYDEPFMALRLKPPRAWAPLKCKVVRPLKAELERVSVGPLSPTGPALPAVPESTSVLTAPLLST